MNFSRKTDENRKKNIGSTDKIIRIILGIVGMVLYFMNIVSGALGMVVVVLAAVMLLTSLINFCPLYTILGVNTCPRKM